MRVEIRPISLDGEDVQRRKIRPSQFLPQRISLGHAHSNSSPVPTPSGTAIRFGGRNTASANSGAEAQSPAPLPPYRRARPRIRAALEPISGELWIVLGDSSRHPQRERCQEDCFAPEKPAARELESAERLTNLPVHRGPQGESKETIRPAKFMSPPRSTLCSTATRWKKESGG